MRKPDESLDEFVVKAQDTTIEPPSPVELRFTGEIEVLKPIAFFQGPAKSKTATTEPNRLSWFHRSLVAGGAFAVGALILASAIFIGIYEGPVNEFTEVAGVSEVPGVSEVAEVSEGAGVSDVLDVLESEIRNPQSEIRNQTVRNRKSFSFNSRRQRHRSQFVQTNFVPTTLVIFIEKGEIKTRIEPQTTADYKKPVTFSN